MADDKENEGYPMEVIVPPHVNDADGGGSGMFAFMHYHVRKNGPNEQMRHHHITRIFKVPFTVQPGATNRNYVDEFGEH